ncbi:MAG: 30S ribosomal protein S4 [Candidatus Kerfeldbacteria bacterium]|nr:30S ribosomal protein S4 [Candidatus Kerfeldbacteria bacterium]
MARSSGSKHRMCRRLGVRVCTTDKCPLMRRNYPPGVHGVKGRPKLTGFGLQLHEKQKARWTYGVLERQFRRYYEEAIRQRGATDAVLLQLLETRLDNVVYRLGLAKNRAAARQLVNHGHITVNGRKVDIPSFSVKAGQVVGVDQVSLNRPYFAALGKNWGKQAMASDWLTADPKEFKGQLLQLPTVEQVKPPFNLKLIVEYYSR